MAYLSLKNVTKEYHSGEVTIKALSGVNLEIEEGELCVIVGPSGAGKTTLLNILGGMDCCTGGEVVLDGEHIEKYDRKALTTYRRDTVVLIRVGLGERLSNFPAQLSGGEQQRVAIARALAKNPKLMLCDEPTGALDYQTGKQVLKLLQDTCRKTGMTVIIITHNSALAPMADRVVHVKNGTVASVELNAKPMPIEEIEW